MNIKRGDTIVLARDWCPDGLTTYRKGTRGVVVDAQGGYGLGSEYKVKFDGHDRTVTMSSSIAEKIL